MQLDLLKELKETEFEKNLANGELILDNSTFIQFDACFAQGMMGGALRRQPLSSSIHLTYGGIVHDALEAHLKEGIDVAGMMELVDQHEDSHKLDPNHPTKNLNKLKELLKAYWIQTQMTPDFEVLYASRLNDSIDSPCVELSFRIPLGPIRFESDLIQVYWEGKIDVLGLYQGEPWIVDHKTTSVMGAKFADTYVRSSQMLGYFYTLMHLIEQGLRYVYTKDGKQIDLEKTLPRGVLINALCSRKSGTEFKVFPIPIPYPRLNEWKEETLARLEFLLAQYSHYKNTQQLIPTREHCVTKYGRCPFFDVCDSPVRARKDMLMGGLYETSTWSPLD